MNHYRTYFSPIEIDQFIYVIGGLSPKNSIPISSERYNMSTCLKHLPNFQLNIYIISVSTLYRESGKI